MYKSELGLIKRLCPTSSLGSNVGYKFCYTQRNYSLKLERN